MSTRQIRKLQRQRELEQQAKLQVDNEKVKEEEEEEEEEEVPIPRKASGFASLALLQQDEDPEEEEEDEESAADNGIAEEPSKPAAFKSKSKKKKKAKAQKKAAVDVESSTPKKRDGPDEIDAALKALNLKPNETTNASADASGSWRRNAEYDRVCSLLGINSQHLKVANEMRSLFGRTATGNHDDAGGAVPRAGRRAQRQPREVDLETALKGQHPPGKGLPEITLRRNPFIQGKDEWPKGTTGGLTMAVVDDMENMDGTIEFRFVHSDAYETCQQQFMMFVEMGQPENLIGLLKQNAYNVSLLLQVSKIAKDQGDHALSSDLIERALFTFGRAAISSFTAKLQAGKARLDFARPENRELWLAGYHYIKSLMMKGTYRTALEWAKLLFALSPEEDHYRMNLMIHNLAVRSYQSEWLLQVFETPMFTVVSHYSTPSVALAAMQAKNKAKSKEILNMGIKSFPWLFCMLFQELNIDPPPSIWARIPELDEVKLFSEIYIRQTKDIWNTPEATSLLKEVASEAKKSNINETMPESVSLDVARYVYLDGTRELMTLLPKELLYRQPNSDSDPLPPNREHNIFSHPSQQIMFESVPNSARGLTEHANLLQAMADVLPQWLRRNRDALVDDGAGDIDEDHDDDDDDDDDDGDESVGDEDPQDWDIPGRFPVGDGEAEEPLGGRAPALFRLMERMFGTGLFEGPGVAEPEVDDDADTDEEMPPLVSGEDDEAPPSASDDDMPPLV